MSDFVWLQVVDITSRNDYVLQSWCVFDVLEDLIPSLSNRLEGELLDARGVTSDRASARTVRAVCRTSGYCLGFVRKSRSGLINIRWVDHGHVHTKKQSFVRIPMDQSIHRRILILVEGIKGHFWVVR